MVGLPLIGFVEKYGFYSDTTGQRKKTLFSGN